MRGRGPQFFLFELSLRCYETNARRTWHIALGPTDIPHTRHPSARPTPAGREGRDSLGRRQTSMLSPGSTTQSKGLGWSGPQVRLTRLELTIYRTEHFRPLAPNPSTSPRAAPRDLGRSRAISGDLGAAPRYLGRSRSVARAASHLLKKGRAWLEPRGSRARSVLAASLCATWAGEAAPRGARRVPRPVHADPCAYRSSSALLGLLLRSRRGTRRDSLPPTSDGLGRFCAPWRLCMSRVPARQGRCQR